MTNENTLTIVLIVIISILSFMLILEWIYIIFKKRREQKNKKIEEKKEDKNIFQKAEEIEDFLNKDFKKTLWKNGEIVCFVKEFEQIIKKQKNGKHFLNFITWKYYEYLLEQIKKGNEKNGTN